MIVSREHRFIFVHIFRTAGRSFTKALKQFGQEEIPGQTHRHHTALEIRDLVGREFWDESFSFAVIRDPWERLLSQYLYHRQTVREFAARHGQKPTKVARRTQRRMRRFRDFDAFIKWCSIREEVDEWTRHKLTQSDFLFDESGTLLVDYILRFETLNEDMRILEGKLGLEIDLPHINYQPHRHYSEYYTDETREMVAGICRHEIEAFGYTWQARPPGADADGNGP
ncbi:sulfotransferase family 2 domain-containing protein [Gemmatimonadota bacterium]